MLNEVPGMLDYLAITACDDGAVIDVSVRNSEDSPDEVVITSLKRVAALDERGWKGFSSDDL